MITLRVQGREIHYGTPTDAARALAYLYIEGIDHVWSNPQEVPRAEQEWIVKLAHELVADHWRSIQQGVN